MRVWRDTKEERRFSEKNTRGSSLWFCFFCVSTTGWVLHRAPWRCRTLPKCLKIHYWTRQTTCWFGERTDGPLLKIVSRCPFHTLYIYIVFIFNIFQFNYSFQLINTCHCSACNLCARHLICSGSGCREALVGIVFPTFMMARASDQLLPTSLFYHRGGFGTRPRRLLFTWLPHFSVEEADLLKKSK